MDASHPTCLYCGEVIRVHEPLVIVEHEGQRESSLAAEPRLQQKKAALLVHTRCAPEGWTEN